MDIKRAAKKCLSNLTKMYFGPKVHLIVVSFFVYLVINLFENLIHYNIGRFSNRNVELLIPTRSDFIKIGIVMMFFAALQGLLTYGFYTV